MHISRSPVLQALLLLKKDGLIQNAPGRGVLVAPLITNDISNLYLLRGALDDLAAEIAAEQKFKLDPALIKRGRKASQGKNLKLMGDAEMAFHAAICGLWQSADCQSAQVYWVHLRRAMGAVLQSSNQRDAIWNERKAIAEAIAAGDVATAGQLIDVHTTHAKKNMSGSQMCSCPRRKVLDSGHSGGLLAQGHRGRFRIMVTSTSRLPPWQERAAARDKCRLVRRPSDLAAHWHCSERPRGFSSEVHNGSAGCAANDRGRSVRRRLLRQTSLFDF
jgi:DNA-binding GntR family transcriptional regulator